MKFKKEDVIKVANAVVEDAVMFWDGGDYEKEDYECKDCFGEKTDTRDEFKHKLDCPVLVAYDLLIKSGEIAMKFKKGDKVIYTRIGLPGWCGAVGYIEGFSHMGINNDVVYNINFNRAISYRTYEIYLIHYSKEAMLKLELDNATKEK